MGRSGHHPLQRVEVPATRGPPQGIHRGIHRDGTGAKQGGSPSPAGGWCFLSEDRKGPPPGEVGGNRREGIRRGGLEPGLGRRYSTVELRRGRGRGQAEWAAEPPHRLQQGARSWVPRPRGCDTHLTGSQALTHRDVEPKGSPEMASQLITRLPPHCGRSTRGGRRETHKGGQARPAPSSGDRAAGNEVERHVSPTSAPRKETVSPRSDPREAKARSPQKSRLADPRAPPCPSG